MRTYIKVILASILAKNTLSQHFSHPAENKPTLDKWLEELLNNPVPALRNGLSSLPSNFCSQSNCLVPVSFSGIWDYGCWCNFGEKLTTGQGPAVNQMDALCKSMQLCLRCAKSDAIAMGETSCEPKKQDFKSDYSQLFFGVTAAAACEQNLDHCSKNTCMCQTNMISQMMKLIFSGYQHENKYYEDQFSDKENFCVNTGNQANINTSCCGYYPNRKTFSENGVRKCCESDQKFYNDFYEQCCDGGVFGLSEVC